jgi:uncharacterized protein YdeI (YjbR/CyaY-like superfamily)
MAYRERWQTEIAELQRILSGLALLKDPKSLLVQLGQVQAARVMRFTSTKEIATKVATIKAFVREAVAAEKARMKVETKPREFPVPE